MSLYQVQLLKIGQMLNVPVKAICESEPEHKTQTFIYTMMVAKSEDRIVVINAGFPDTLDKIIENWKDWNPDCHFERPEALKVESQLERIGIEPEKVDILILNPLAQYCTGKINLFKNAQLYLNRREWIDYIAPQAKGQEDNPHEIVFPKNVAQELVFDSWERLNFIEGEVSICPGIRVFPYGAHHHGSMAIVIDTPAGSLIYADSIFSYLNLNKESKSEFCVSEQAFINGLKKCKSISNLIIPISDPEVFEKYPDGVIV